MNAWLSLEPAVWLTVRVGTGTQADRALASAASEAAAVIRERDALQLAANSMVGVA